VTILRCRFDASASDLNEAGSLDAPGTAAGRLAPKETPAMPTAKPKNNRQLKLVDRRMRGRDNEKFCKIQSDLRFF
jgi:hypothetical protein